jgi:hypothetical protein
LAPPSTDDQIDICDSYAACASTALLVLALLAR